MRRSQGFTLMEILIVVAIIGVLAAVAFPSYQNHVRKSNRAGAQAFMMDVASKQALYLSTARGYAASLTDLQMTAPAEVTRFYTVTLDAPVAVPPAFTVTATPKSGTVQEADPVLTLDDKGTKSPSDKW
jgi:type IV pilus assembly protein PilE